jgi:hypothetical protein
MDKPQISPLRYAPVEMTKGRVVMARSRGLGMDKPQISPLRYAPVEMTKGRTVLPGRVVAEQEQFFSIFSLSESAPLPFVISTGA